MKMTQLITDNNDSFPVTTMCEILKVLEQNRIHPIYWKLWIHGRNILIREESKNGVTQYATRINKKSYRYQVFLHYLGWLALPRICL